MKIKLINKKTSEFEILDCIDFDSSSILIQAGSGTMLMNYDENEYEVEKVSEETITEEITIAE